MKKILVTGKNGNISIAISDWLTNKHNLITEQISLRKNDWEDGDFSCFNTVVHVAGIVPKEGVNPQDFYNINHLLTEKFARKVKADGVKHFIYISSMAVYGVEPQMDSEKGTVNVETPCNPTSDYGKSKFFAEESLKKLEDENFKITIIRVPSIYGKGKTEYLDQYKHIAEKFCRIPKAFIKNYKSMIYIDNLCELIYLIIKNEKYGVVCPDDGQISAFDICKSILPHKNISKTLGFMLALVRNSDRVRDYYGTVCYCTALTDVFSGEYRVCGYKEAVKRSYEN